MADYKPPMALLHDDRASLLLKLQKKKNDHDIDSDSRSYGGAFDCLLFDLDDTLYPFSTGISAACAQNIKDYMVAKLGLGREEAEAMNKELYARYGTSMAGLVAKGYSLDSSEYHAIVHGSLPYERLQPDLQLRSLLLRLPQRKLIFTNADYGHACRALARLRIQDCFESIICFETFNADSTNHSNVVVCKPSETAFLLALRIAAVDDPRRALFFDDSRRNISAAKSVGLGTVLVGTAHDGDCGADYGVDSIHNIADAIPHILHDHISSNNTTYSSLPEAISVRA